MATTRSGSKLSNLIRFSVVSVSISTNQNPRNPRQQFEEEEEEEERRWDLDSTIWIPFTEHASHAFPLQNTSFHRRSHRVSFNQKLLSFPPKTQHSKFLTDGISVILTIMIIIIIIPQSILKKERIFSSSVSPPILL
jgi:hypothetical protein